MVRPSPSSLLSSPPKPQIPSYPVALYLFLNFVKFRFFPEPGNAGGGPRQPSHQALSPPLIPFIDSFRLKFFFQYFLINISHSNLFVKVPIALPSSPPPPPLFKATPLPLPRRPVAPGASRTRTWRRRTRSSMMRTTRWIRATTTTSGSALPSLPFPSLTLPPLSPITFKMHFSSRNFSQFLFFRFESSPPSLPQSENCPSLWPL